MQRTTRLLLAALTRPLNVLALGAGLLLALTYAPWWVFPLSLVPYSIMVMLALRDPAFVASQVRDEQVADAGETLKWGDVARELGGGLPAPIARIAESEQKLAGELSSAPEGARTLLASTLAQVRTAARLAIELARKVQGLDHTLRTYPAMNFDRLRRDAEERRRAAAATKDAEARASMLDAAKSLEDSATSAESMLKLRDRTVAQLDNLAASLENVSLKSLRLRVADDGSSEAAQALRIDIDAIKETLGVFESPDVAEVASGRGAARAQGDR